MTYHWRKDIRGQVTLSIAKILKLQHHRAIEAHTSRQPRKIMFTMMISKAAFTLFVITNVVAAWAPARRHVSSSLLRVTRARSIYYGNNNNNKYGFVATQLHSTTVSTSSVSTEVVGTEGTESFRLLFKDASNTVSPWHNIPMKNDDGTYNMVRSFLFEQLIMMIRLIPVVR